MTSGLLHAEIDGLELVHRGKVRETYRVDDEHLLLVATDRLSAFDVVFDQRAALALQRMFQRIQRIGHGRVDHGRAVHWLRSRSSESMRSAIACGSMR